jgi:hypothetical protein
MMLSSLAGGGAIVFVYLEVHEGDRRRKVDNLLRRDGLGHIVFDRVVVKEIRSELRGMYSYTCLGVKNVMNGGGSAICGNVMGWEYCLRERRRSSGREGGSV